MSQNDFNIANQGFPATRADINSALQALASNSAGTAEPSTTYAYQFWYDETNELLKMRNSDNDAWITIGTFDQTGDTFTPAGITTDKIEEGNSSVEVVDTGTGYVAITVDGAEAARVDANGRLGIGTTSPSADLDLRKTSTGGSTEIRVYNTDNSNTTTQTATLFLAPDSRGNGALIFAEKENADFSTSAARDVALVFSPVKNNTQTEAMRIDSSGNLLVGKTTTTSDPDTGMVLQADGVFKSTSDGTRAGDFNRGTSDGEIIRFSKDGSTVGSIGVETGRPYFSNGGNFAIKIGSNALIPANPDGSTSDNAEDLGASSVRWDDVYATNGTIQTSDRNEKQDIEALSDAEQRVAVAAKGLLRKYRWKDAVAEKGDAARIHFGIIAQDLQAAFEAEGLDAGRYGMFISSTWWETYRVIPAVEAQDAVYETVVIPAEYDADGNEISPETTEERLVSEAVEAQPEQTVTDTYDTQEEAPEGAVERTRMGVRYPELLAFIIAAI